MVRGGGRDGGGGGGGALAIAALCVIVVVVFFYWRPVYHVLVVAMLSARASDGNYGQFAASGSM